MQRFRDSSTTARFAARWTVAVIIPALLTVACAGSKSGSADPAPKSGSATANGTVGQDEIARAPKESVDQYLAGRFSGVQITPTAEGGIAVRIRGSTSVHGNNEPLYILDGVAIQPGANGALTGINPHDIASIKVLKDLADITMYGVRGANGVIIIKTKRANQ